jgi:C-terminal processing protease CtpA/Prc
MNRKSRVQEEVSRVHYNDEIERPTAQGERMSLSFEHRAHLVAAVAVSLSLTALCAARAGAATEPHASEHATRMAQLGRLWGAIEYLDPYVWTHDIDWDAALLRGLPKVRAAASEDEFAGAVNALLSALHDPATHVYSVDAQRSPAVRKTTLIEWPKPGILLVRLNTAENLTPEAVAKVTAALASAKAVIFDLRADSEEIGARQPEAGLPLYRQLLSRPVYLPPRRWLFHEGYSTDVGTTSGDFSRGFITSNTQPIVPAKGARRRPAVFIVNDKCDYPDVGLGMQAIGDAAFVVIGAKPLDQLTVGLTLPIGRSHVAMVRTADWAPLPGTPAPHADATLPASSDEATVMRTALRLAGSMPRARAAPPLPPMMARHHDPYEQDKAPDLDHRLLALFRLWSTIDLFYPYKALLDEAWDDELPKYVPRFEAADSADAYAEALAELSAHLDDSHVSIHGSGDWLASTLAPPPFLARVIEGKPIVVRVLADAAGVHIGDELLAIDGEPVAQRIDKVRRFVACSTPGACGFSTLRRALGGAEGSVAAVTLRGADGKARTVSLPRHNSFRAQLGVWRSGDVVRVLDGNIGYVDLDRLPPDGVDALFDKLGKTRAIIFDVRGYPHGTGWEIASRLNIKRAPFGASFQRPMVRGDRSGTQSLMFQPLPATDRPLYRGKVFLLVDERTASQAEHLGLLFEAAAPITCVGGPTNGTNGDVTMLALPGGLTMSFSGNDVRHADFKQLQRVGLHIDVRIAPTISGLRSGRDDVLERALQLARALPAR